MPLLQQVRLISSSLRAFGIYVISEKAPHHLSLPRLRHRPRVASYQGFRYAVYHPSGHLLWPADSYSAAGARRRNPR